MKKTKYLGLSTNKKSATVAALAAVAALNPDGFTVDAQTLQPVCHGYAVAVKETQNSFGTEGLERVTEYAATHSRVTAFGGWLDTESGLYYYDAVIICSTYEEAEETARYNEQLAFFDLERMQEIRIKY